MFLPLKTLTLALNLRSIGARGPEDIGDGWRQRAEGQDGSREELGEAEERCKRSIFFFCLLSGSNLDSPIDSSSFFVIDRLLLCLICGQEASWRRTRRRCRFKYLSFLNFCSRFIIKKWSLRFLRLDSGGGLLDLSVCVEEFDDFGWFFWIVSLRGLCCVRYWWFLLRFSVKFY